MSKLNAYMKVTILLVVAAAAGTLHGENEVRDGRSICAVAVQDRSQAPVSTVGLDELVRRAIIDRGLDVRTVEFDRPADVEHAAREKGCSHILYTDIIRANESAGSRTCRAIKRVMAADGGATMNAEVEFRLFAVDDVLPLVSTSVKGKARARQLYPKVSSRVVELQQADPGVATATHQHRTAALSDAFEAQARIVSFSMPRRGE